METICTMICFCVGTLLAILYIKSSTAFKRTYKNHVTVGTLIVISVSSIHIGFWESIGYFTLAWAAVLLSTLTFLKHIANNYPQTKQMIREKLHVVIISWIITVLFGIIIPELFVLFIFFILGRYFFERTFYI